MAWFNKGETDGSPNENEKIKEVAGGEPEKAASAEEKAGGNAGGKKGKQKTSGAPSSETIERAYSPVTQMEPEGPEVDSDEGQDRTWDRLQELQAREEKSTGQIPKKQVDDAVIDKTVDATVDIYNRKVHAGAMTIAELVARDIVQWDLKETLPTDLFKNEAYSRYSQHPRLTVDPRRIAEWVKAFVCKKELIAEGVSVDNLGLHHLIHLLKVKDPTMRAALAIEVNDNNYSVRKTRDEVEKLNGRESSEGLMKSIIRQLQDPRTLLRDKKMRETLEDPAKLKDSLDSDERLNILTAVEKTKKDAVKVQAMLTKIGNTIFQVEQEERAGSNN